ncbi:catechol 2,3-dioxygenase-like lactoylglutathione lyase family enzyme [Nitrospirillum amazonense]|uniref:Catechol 2,3-dioxygenase-like lactoylglutathione lyase family enzyme n=1 Tax=Nitrospirillum amazonense TaxID=28077 RepID=A0A560FA41_9PROT|nr:VOC family protein [Nitrospirillum amazonense]TWB18483.1 catechol 2,3-dioxygenase-like lactoylglutathione lyase family enzyme [Nitrospirillum amazonense]
MAASLGFRHIVLTVADIDRAATFYQRIMGLARVRTEPHTITLAAPGLRYVMNLTDRKETRAYDGGPDAPIGSLGGIDHLGIEVDEPAEVEPLVREWLAAGGRLLERRDMDTPYPSAFMRDLDGYLVQIYSFAAELRARVP